MNMDKYEIGMSFSGNPTEEQKVSCLQAVLDKYGDDPHLWVRAPEIIQWKTAVYTSGFTQSAPLRVEPARWGYYGVLRDEPEDTKVVLAEGTQHMKYVTYSPDLV